MSTDLPLERIRSARLSDVAVDQLAALIADGHLNVGDKLPSERELIERLGVSRASVREALRILEAQGILEVQPGRGAFVVATMSQVGLLPGILNWLREHKQQVLEVVEVREAIESKASYLAAQRITDAEIAALRQTLALMETYHREGRLDELTTADRTFHRQICDASGNDFLRALADHIVEALSDFRHSIFGMPGRAVISLAEHRRIVEALENRDPDAAVATILDHLQSVKRALSDLPADHDGQPDGSKR
jgi:GntR family transcriptional regulator, transcriptional repressor for pyruvate dehydrogenase complex